jgi:hypothetical protein
VDAQNNDNELLTALQEFLDKYSQKLLAQNANLICHILEPNAPFKICIPTKYLDKLVKWYHLIISHLGAKHMAATIGQHFYYKNLEKHCQTVCNSCDHCQHFKQQGKGYGHLPPQEAQVAPWYTVAVNSIGDWVIKIPGHNDVKFQALMIIDPITNLTEILCLDLHSSHDAAQQFTNTWLARYLHPMECVFDPGMEFKAHFCQCLAQHGITARLTTVKNPQANAICECLHQMIGNSLRMMQIINPPQTVEEAHQLVDNALATASYALCAAIHPTMKISPRALAFHHDMLLDIPTIADLQVLQQW